MLWKVEGTTGERGKHGGYFLCSERLLSAGGSINAHKPIRLSAIRCEVVRFQSGSGDFLVG